MNRKNASSDCKSHATSAILKIRRVSFFSFRSFVLASFHFVSFRFVRRPTGLIHPNTRSPAPAACTGKRWCATLERSEAGNLHVHLQLQFRKVLHRTTGFFAWQGRRPYATSSNYLGEGLRKGAYYQQSVDRAFFYVFADGGGVQRDPQGNECVDGNYFPAWV